MYSQSRLSQSLASMRPLEDLDLIDEAIHHGDDQLFIKTPTYKKVTSMMDACIHNEEETEHDFEVDQIDQCHPFEAKYVSRTNNMLHEDHICPIGLKKVDSGSKFAERHLFRNGFKSSNNLCALAIEEEEDQSSSGEDGSCYSDEQDQESLQEADLTDPSNLQYGCSVGSNLNLDTDEGLGSFNQLSSHFNIPKKVEPSNDMFMACCDWEAAIEAERHSLSSRCSTPKQKTDAGHASAPASQEVQNAERKLLPGQKTEHLQVTSTTDERKQCKRKTKHSSKGVSL